MAFKMNGWSAFTKPDEKILPEEEQSKISEENKEKKVEGTESSIDYNKLPFDKAFYYAKNYAKKDKFSWKGKEYTTKTK